MKLKSLSAASALSLFALSALSTLPASSAAQSNPSEKNLSEQIDLALAKGLKKNQIEKEVKTNSAPKKVTVEGTLGAGYNTAQKDIEVTDLSILLGFQINPRIYLGVDLDGRAALGKDQVKERLQQDPQFRRAVENAIRAAISAHLGIPAQYIKVPTALLEKTVKETVDQAINDDAVIESTVRQIYVTVTALQGDSDGNGNLVLTAGKVDPVYYNSEAFGHFATSTPTLRIGYEFNDWNIDVSAYNNRFGENWNIDGTVAGQVTNVLEKAHNGGRILDFELNSYEVALERTVKSLGRVILAAGMREYSEDDSSNYLVVRVDSKLGKFNISTTVSAEQFDQDSKEAPDGNRYRETLMISREVSQKLSVWLQAYYGTQTGTTKTTQQAVVLGADRKLLETRRTSSSLRAALFDARDSVKGHSSQQNRGGFLGVIVRFHRAK